MNSIQPVRPSGFPYWFPCIVAVCNLATLWVAAADLVNPAGKLFSIALVLILLSVAMNVVLALLGAVILVGMRWSSKSVDFGKAICSIVLSPLLSGMIVVAVCSYILKIPIKLTH